MEDTEHVLADNSGGSSGGTSGACPGARGLFLQHLPGSPTPMSCPGSRRPHLRKLRGAGPHQAISIQDRLF